MMRSGMSVKPIIKFKWTKRKPNFPCLFISRSKWKDYWTYDIWEIVHSDEWNYDMLIDSEGYEWGPLEDLNEQEYMLIEDHRKEGAK